MPLSECVYCVVITFKMTERVEQQIYFKFCIKLNIPPWKLLGRFRRPQLWATGDWQLHHNNVPAQVSSLIQFFGKTSNHPGDSAPLQHRFGTLRLLSFPKTKITFEREEISDHRWDLGKYSWQGSWWQFQQRILQCFEQWKRLWENCVRCQGTYFEGDWGITVLCTMFLVSCILYLFQ